MNTTLRRLALLGAGAATLASGVSTLPATPAVAAPSYANFYVADDIATGIAQTTMTLGAPGDRPFTGDPNGDGLETIALQSGTTVRMYDDPTRTQPTTTLTIPAGYDAYFGDWNGDGVDSLGLHQRGTNHFRVTDSPKAESSSYLSLTYGRVGDEVHIGDWNGDGKDTFGLRRGNVFHLKNDISSGPADVEFAYGRADDVVHVGDWDGRDGQTIAVRRGTVFYFKNSFTSGPADREQSYGRVTDEVLIGDWSGDGREAPAVRRIESNPLPLRVSPKILQAWTAAQADRPPGSATNPATAVTFHFDPIHHYDEASTPYDLNIVSALAPLRALVTVSSVANRDVQLQYSENGGRSWTTAWASGATSGAWVSQYVDMPALDRGTHVTRQYRIWVGPGGGENAVASTPQEIVHQDPRAFAAGSAEKRMYDNFAPYCPAVPLRFVGSAASSYVEEGGREIYAGMAYTSTRDQRMHQMIQFAELYRTPQRWQNTTHDAWMLHLALHECAHIVEMRHMALNAGSIKAGDVYPALSEGDAHEALADQLARHWTLTNPGRNTSPSFVAGASTAPYADVTQAKRYRGGYDMTRYPGDDAYLARLTDFALREAAPYR